MPFIFDGIFLVVVVVVYLFNRNNRIGTDEIQLRIGRASSDFVMRLHGQAETVQPPSHPLRFWFKDGHFGSEENILMDGTFIVIIILLRTLKRP